MRVGDAFHASLESNPQHFMHIRNISQELHKDRHTHTVTSLGRNNGSTVHPNHRSRTLAVGNVRWTMSHIYSTSTTLSRLMSEERLVRDEDVTKSLWRDSPPHKIISFDVILLHGKSFQANVAWLSHESCRIIAIRELTYTTGHRSVSDCTSISKGTRLDRERSIPRPPSYSLCLPVLPVFLLLQYSYIGFVVSLAIKFMVVIRIIKEVFWIFDKYKFLNNHGKKILQN